MAKQVMPEIDRDLCIRCGDCVDSCPADALALGDEGIVLDEEQCAYCGDCEDVCPQGAIRLPYDIVLPDHRDTQGES